MCTVTPVEPFRAPLRRALNVILLSGAALTFVGAIGLMMFGRPGATARDTR